MATLSKAERDKLPADTFVDPQRRLFPITDQEDVERCLTMLDGTEDPNGYGERLHALCKAKGLTLPSPAAAGFAAVGFSTAPQGTAQGDYVLRDVPILMRTGDYEFDKQGTFSFTPEDVLGACKTFKAPVPLKNTHKESGSVFDGIDLGSVVELRPASDTLDVLGGTARIPVWLDTAYKDQPLQCSANFDWHTKRLTHVALVTNPRIPDAALFAAFAADTVAKAKGKQSTPHGTQAMQDLHDTAARSGAMCSGKGAEFGSSSVAGSPPPTGYPPGGEPATAEFTSADERDTFQQVHDLTQGGGAKCNLFTASKDKDKKDMPAPFAATKSPREIELEAKLAEEQGKRREEEDKRRAAEAGQIAATFSAEFAPPFSPHQREALVPLVCALAHEVAQRDAAFSKASTSSLELFKAFLERLIKDGIPDPRLTKEVVPGTAPGALFALPSGGTNGHSMVEEARRRAEKWANGN
jgi:hypothetical protein